MLELVVGGLQVSYPSPQGESVVVNDVTFRMGAERLGIVGESGSGKSQTARALLGLIAAPGRVQAQELSLNGLDLQRLNVTDWQGLRGSRIGMVMQDPKYSLNPVKRVMDQIVEVAHLHGADARARLQQRALELLHAVGIEDAQRVARAYPHQLSGGLAQRVMIAAMLINSPELLIADEPTSALDVMLRSQVLRILDTEVTQRGMGLILISHDLNTVARYCDRVLIMYRGRIVESCDAKRLFEARHPYTRGLLGCLPSARTRGQLLPVLNRAALQDVGANHV
jgi:peptide/nickel transport system ATP-binding protein